MRGLRPAELALVLALPGLCACNARPGADLATGSSRPTKVFAATDAERDCLGRAMYFESKRADGEGLLAVGTVVMNRVEADPSASGICDVVGRPRQFATGVLTKAMDARDLEKIADVADAVLAGERHPKVGRAMHFHTAGLRFPYDNMHYVAVAGGNAFYEKRKRGAPERAPTEPSSTAMAMTDRPAAAATPLAYAAAEPDIVETRIILSEPAKDICRVASLAGGGRG